MKMIETCPENNWMFFMQDIKGQCWTDEESDGENEPEQFLYGIQVNSSQLKQVKEKIITYNIYSLIWLNVLK